MRCSKCGYEYPIPCDDQLDSGCPRCGYDEYFAMVDEDYERETEDALRIDGGESDPY